MSLWAPVSEQCTAKAKGTGKRCKRSVPGGGVCASHGGKAPQVKAKRLERIALAERLAATPQRHPAMVLLDAVHTADVLAGQAREELRSGTASVKTVKALVEATIRQAALARSALSADAESRMVQSTDRHARHLQPVLALFLERVGLAGDRRAGEAMAEAVAIADSGGDPVVARAVEMTTARLDEGAGRLVVDVIRWVMAGLGLEADPRADPWLAAQIAVGLRALGTGVLPDFPAEPSQGWWRQLRDRADEHLRPEPLALTASPAPVMDDGTLEGTIVTGGPR